MSEYKNIRQQLLARYQEIQERLGRITRDVRRVNKPLDADFAEQAVELENKDVLDALDDSIRAEMEQIQMTLSRLDNGQYGICAVCGEKIPVKRLEALPHTSHCVVCAEQATA